jgi:hypothetical protein
MPAEPLPMSLVSCWIPASAVPLKDARPSVKASPFMRNRLPADVGGFSGERARSHSCT